MRRLAFADWLLIGGLIPIWLLCVSVSIYGHTRFEIGRLPVIVDSPVSQDDYPVVTFAWGTDVLRPGDKLMRIDDRDLRGQPRALVWSARPNRHGLSRVHPTLIERDGVIQEVELQYAQGAAWWKTLPFSISLVVCALLLLVRAREWHLGRRFFGLSMVIAIEVVSVDAGIPAWEVAATIARLALTPLGYGLVLWNVFEWQALRPDRPRWQKIVPWAISADIMVLVIVAGWLTTPIPGRVMEVVFSLTTLGTGILAIWHLSREYRNADALEQRRARWALLGLYVTSAGIAVMASTDIVRVPVDVFRVLWSVNAATMCAVPIGILVSVVWYDYLDVDRVIGATATYSVLIASLGGLGLLGIPQLAEVLAGWLNFAPASTSVALSFALALTVVPAQRALRPRVDRTLFREQHRREQAIAELLDAMARCEGVRDLAGLVGERVDATFEPESVAIYARDGEAFTPLFVRARTAPPAFSANSALVATLTVSRTPVLAALGRFDSEPPLDAFDLAALQALDAAVVLPIRRGDALLAFLCLGPKRSGDIFVPTDHALLMAIATGISERLQRLDADQVLGEARALQESLRRYVPGAVAEVLESGRELEPEVREVCVLFVDIRGYVALSEGHDDPEIFATINSYTEAISEIVARNAGNVVEFNGDGMMAVFGAIGDAKSKERSAVAAAREIIASVARMDLEGEPISVGIGVATGSAYVGEIRSVDRRIWSAFGNTTNLAARLQTLTRSLDAAICIDAVTRERAGGLCAGFVEHVDVAIRGRREHLSVYVLPLGSEA